MQAKGPKIERETVIIFNEVDEMADIWTASNRTYKKLLKLGLCPTEDNDRSAAFKVPKKCVAVRKPKAISERRLKALEAARTRIQRRSEQNGLSVQHEKGQTGSAYTEVVR